jgi:hypothetical protein
MSETADGSSSRSKDLVEPEGVNAASRELIEAHSGGGDVTSGGAPERAGEQISERQPLEQMAGTSGGQDGGPGQQLSVGEG